MDTQEWIQQQQTKYGEDLLNTGGFTMVCGVLRRRFNEEHKAVGIEPFHMLSNRGGDCGVHLFSEAAIKSEAVPATATLNTTICGDNLTNQPPPHDSTEADDSGAVSGQTIGVSNSMVTRPWPKVKLGVASLEKLVAGAVENKLSEAELVSELVGLMNTDTYPRPIPTTCKCGGTCNTKKPPRIATGTISNLSSSSHHETLDLDKVFYNLRYSVFVPTINLQKVQGEEDSKQEESTTAAGATDSDGVHYGTRTNTIILVSRTGHVKYIERTLHTEDTVIEKNGVQESVYEFDIEGF